MSDTLHPALATLFAKRPQVIKPGLERIQAGLRALQGLGEAAPSVVIGGTNGKGTTTGFLFQLLAGAGVKTGIFTSPHLVRFSERIQTGHAAIDDETLLGDLAALRAALPVAAYDTMSFFEVNTLLALWTFRRLGTEINLMEVGLGGRWDSVNALDPCLSVITSIGMDHCQYLGDTTAKIAAEKAGIMRRGRPVLWGGVAGGDANARAAIEEQAKEKGALLWQLGEEIVLREDRVEVVLPGFPEASYRLPMVVKARPAFLRRNFALACAAAHWLQARLVPNGSVARGLVALDQNKVPIPPSLRARFERLLCGTKDGTTRDLLLDVGHNVDGVRALVSALVESGIASADRKLPGLVSVLADKDYDGVLDVLRTVLDPIALFPVQSERTWTKSHLAPRHQDLYWHPSFADAFADKRMIGSPTVICGSVLALGEVLGTLIP